MNEQEKRRYEEEQNSLVPSDEAMNALFAAAKNATSQTAERQRSPRVLPQIAFRRLGVACLAAAMLLLVLCLPLQSILPAPQNGGTLSPSTPNPPESSVKEPVAQTLGSYDELLKFYNSLPETHLLVDILKGGVSIQGNRGEGMVGNSASSSDSANDSSDMEEHTSAPNAAQKPSHSETNNQVAGVQEGDVVKTDGTYVYSLFLKPATPYPRGLQICTLTDEGEAKKVAFLALEDLFPSVKNPYTYADCDLYLHDEKLLIIRRSDTEEQTLLTVLSVEGGTPKIEAQFRQSGYYNSARLIGDAFYLVTDDPVSSARIKEEDPTTFVPSCGKAEHVTLIAPGDIHVMEPEHLYQFQYTVVSSYSLSGEAKMTSSKAVLGNVEHLYASTESLYTLCTRYNGYSKESDILRFSLDEAGVELAAEGSVLGSPLNQFSMQEKDGVFTVVTTYHTKDSVNYNGVYTFDQSLKALGALDGLGKDERVYSVRFDGDLCYFVTYRQTDPVFCVDLSDVASPKLLSALKIPGYSSYLHVWDEDTLFGIGRADEDENGITEEIKISFFDTANKEELLETQKILLGNEMADSPAETNHKAILVAPEKNVIAFAYVERQAVGFPSVKKYENTLVLLREERDGFATTELLLPSREDDNSAIQNRIDYTRFLYVGDVLCVVMPDGIQTIDLNTFGILSTLWF